MINIYIDGSSFGNPGDSGIGVVFLEGENNLKNISRYIGTQTNNVAEYSALICALQEALVMKMKEICIFSDSELLCKQIKGEYKVKNENIKNLFSQAVGMIQGFENFCLKQIPREKNVEADKLARLAVKEKRSKVDGIAAHHAKKREGGKSEL